MSTTDNKWSMSLEWFDKCKPEDFRNGATISAIKDVIKERDALRTQLAAATEREGRMREALIPLKRIADAYDDNMLDDEARKAWGADGQYTNTRPPENIELYSGRGGRQLLTLQHCFDARSALSPTAAEPTKRAK